MKTLGDYEAVIVGYGPVGAYCALQFGHAGLRVAIVDRTSEIMQIPRAVGLDGEAMRGMQRLGFADAVEPILQPPRARDEVCFADSKRNVLFGQDIGATGALGWRDLAFFDQPQLEAVLRTRVDEHSGIDVFNGFEVTGLDLRDDGVGVSGEHEGERASLEAAWVIGCDGASSFVRRAIGSEWKSLGYDRDWLVVDIEMRTEAQLPEAVMQVCDPKRLTTYVCCRDPYRRWEFQLNPGESREHFQQPETIASLLDDWLPRDHYSLRRAAVYQFHAAVASQWRSGRVLLAGDAAHQTPPFLGQGLNSGFRDAVSLGWKLPLVHSGLCDAALLDRYQEERSPHSSDLVDRAVGVGQLMETLAAREAGLPDPYTAAEVRASPTDGQLIPPLRAGVLLDEQVGRYASVGLHMFQPRVSVDSGEPQRFDELLGGGFAVVGRTQADCSLGDDARVAFERLSGRTVSLDTCKILDDKVDRLFEEHPAVLLRPDRQVFGVVDAEHSLDDLVLSLARKVHLAS
jgi:flavoprotein hydroxylase